MYFQIHKKRELCLQNKTKNRLYGRGMGGGNICFMSFHFRASVAERAALINANLRFSLAQDYVLVSLNEKDYFGRKATFTALSEIHVEGFVNSRIRHFLALTRQRPQSFFLGLRALKENRLEPYSTNMMFTKNVTQKHVLTHKKTQKLCV